MTGRTEPVGILRRACDRCHGQKLSCQRDGNDSSRPCARCLRDDTPCSTSLSQRNRRIRPLPSAMSTTVVSPTTTSLKRLRGRQSDGSHDHDDAPRNPLAELPEPASGSGPVNQDHFNDATNDGIQKRLAWPSPSAETMDWISFDWANGGLNPFSAADFDPSNRGATITPHVLGSFPEPLDGLQNLGAVTSLSSPAPARDAGDPFLGYDGEAGHTPKPPSVASISIPGSRAGQSHASGEGASSHPTRADGQWLQRLVQINMQLFDHANKAKASAGDSDPVADPTADNEASSPTIHRPPGFNSFDETIVLCFYLAGRSEIGTKYKSRPIAAIGFLEDLQQYIFIFATQYIQHQWRQTES